jgi:hypothetical protein
MNMNDGKKKRKKEERTRVCSRMLKERKKWLV